MPPPPNTNIDCASHIRSCLGSSRMPSFRKRRRYRSSDSHRPVKRHSWERRFDGDDCEDKKIEAGGQLEEFLLTLFALGKLDCKSLCIICHLCKAAGAAGEGLKKYAVAPGKTSNGAYKKHLDTVLPQCESAPELHVLKVPSWRKNQRSSKAILVAPPHELLNAELEAVKESSGIEVKPPDPEWTEDWARHPHRVRPGDNRDVFPISLYLDGIKFNRALGPRADTLVAITVYNAQTMKRHLVAIVLKRDLCHCGCHGWCTLWAVYNYIAWSISAATVGSRPRVRWDGTRWPDGSASLDLVNREPQMAARFVLCQIKGDWEAYCNLLGFPTWSAHHVPCLWCRASRSTLYQFLREFEKTTYQTPLDGWRREALNIAIWAVWGMVRQTEH
eukprot:9504172-Pyramimonas_sp.AAC.1